MRLSICTVDLSSGRVDFEGRAEQLTDLERRLLVYLSAHPGRDVPREELLAEVWGYASGVVTRAVTATVHRLRAKIERNPAEPDHVLTVWGKGFRFEPFQAPSTAPLLDRTFGRSELRDKVLASLGTQRLVTLVGIGGIGKTRLARQVVEGARRPWFWVDGGAARTRHDLESLVAAFEPVEGPEGALLVLDNLEGAVDAAAEGLPDWLARWPGARVLVTSREALHLGGEVVFAVGPLEPGAARALLLDRMPPALSPADADVAALIPLLDGIPLAIELAARLTDVLTLPQLVSRLQRGLDCLTEDRRGRDVRHASLRAALEGSYEQLDDADRQSLARLSVIEATFELEDAEALLGDQALASLRRLAHKSLLHREPGGHRLLHPVKTFAIDHLDPADQQATRRAWGDWLVARSRAYADEADVGSTESLAWTRRHLPDLSRTWEDMLDVDSDASFAILRLLYAHYLGEGPAPTNVRLVETTLQRPVSDPVRARLQLLLARQLNITGHTERAKAYATEALSTAEALDDPWLEGRTALALVVFGSYREWRVDVPLVRRALAAHERARDDVGRARTLLIMAIRHVLGLRFDEAIATGLESARAHEAVGSVRGRCRAMSVVAGAHGERGEFDIALSLLDEVMEIQRALNDPLLVALVMQRRGIVALLAGDVAAAVGALAQSLELSLAAKVSPKTIAEVSHALALAHVRAGNLAAAAEVLGESLPRARSHGVPHGQSELLEAWVQARQGRLDRGRALAMAPPKTHSDTDERLCALLRGLLLVETMPHPDARAEARQLLQRGIDNRDLDLPSWGGPIYLEWLARELDP